MCELIQRDINMSGCKVRTSVIAQVSTAQSMQDNFRRLFGEYMPPVKINFEFQPERPGNNLILIEGLFSVEFPERQMKIEFRYRSGWRDTIKTAVEAYRMNGNLQSMSMLQVLTAMDLSVRARQEILESYFEFIMGYTQAQMKPF